MAVCPVVAVVNMKGGVGKTTVAANVFYELYRTRGVSILLVDFDPQFNLTQSLLTQADYSEVLEQHRTLHFALTPTLHDSFLAVTDTDHEDPGLLDKYVWNLKRASRKKASVDLLPGDFRLSRLNLTENSSALRVPRARFSRLIQEAREQYGVVVLDCNPSSSPMMRMAVEQATDLLVPVEPDRYSRLGLDMIDDYARSLPGRAAPPTLHVVANNVDPKVQTQFESDIRADEVFGDRTLVSRIRTTKILESTRSHAGFAVDRGGPYSAVVTTELRAVASEFADAVKI